MYTVVHLAITYKTVIQYSFKDTQAKGLGPVIKLFLLQNKYLRLIIRGYKAINTKVLEVESEIIFLNIYFNQITLKLRDKPRCSEVIKLERIKIRKKLSNKREKKYWQELSQSQLKYIDQKYHR